MVLSRTWNIFNDADKIDKIIIFLKRNPLYINKLKKNEVHGLKISFHSSRLKMLVWFTCFFPWTYHNRKANLSKPPNHPNYYPYPPPQPQPPCTITIPGSLLWWPDFSVKIVQFLYGRKQWRWSVHFCEKFRKRIWVWNNGGTNVQQV